MVLLLEEVAGGGRGYLAECVRAATAHGGTAKLNISGGTVYAGSIGGGAPLQDSSMNKFKFGVGAALVDISGGNIYGQIVMQGTINEVGDDYGKQSTFKMTGGIIDNTSPNDGNKYLFVEENGGAVYINSGKATLSGGTIQNCSSENEARNTIRRLKETKKQIRLLRKYAEDKNIVYSAPYKRELQKAEKGLRRIYKILHSRTSEEDYNAIINYATYTIDYLNREDLFKLPNQIEPEIKRLEKTKNEILTFKEKLALE